MTTVEELHGYVDDSYDKVEELRQTVNNCLNGLPWWVPDFVIDFALEKWNELMDKVNTAFADFTTAINAIGQPLTLREAADRWTSDVRDKLSGLSGRVGEGLLTSDEVFQGEAADAYRGIIPAQKDAVAAVSAFPEPISQTLDAVADAIDNWCAAMVVAVFALLGAIAAAIASVATAATGAGPIIGICAAIACVLTFAGALITAEVTMNNACEAAQSDLSNHLANWEGFDGQNWPAATFPG